MQNQCPDRLPTSFTVQYFNLRDKLDLQDIFRRFREEKDELDLRFHLIAIFESNLELSNSNQRDELNLRDIFEPNFWKITLYRDSILEKVPIYGTNWCRTKCPVNQIIQKFVNYDLKVQQ